MAWNLTNVIKWQKKSRFGVLVETWTSVQQTFQANIILRQIKIWENFKIQLNDSWFLKCKKLYVTPLVHQKLTYLPWHLWFTRNWLIASRIDRPTGNCVSWKPEPEAFAVDAFSINWSHHFSYIFPPFSLLTKVIKKICWDQATGILLFPAWSLQLWYLQAFELSDEVPLKIRPNLTNLILPQDKAAVHPFAEKLTLHIIKFNTMVD